MAGEFIALEGGEGVGKTTQMNLLKERLPGLFPDRDFVFTREPGGTPFADKIRALILSDDAKEVDAKVMFGLFIAARAEHFRHTIIPAFEAGKTVVTDRFVGATYAYQACAQEDPIDKDLFDAYFSSLDYRPDLTIILDMDPEVAAARASGRTTQAYTHFDARSLDFHQRLRKGYEEFAERYNEANEHIVLINAEKGVEAVHAGIVALIRAVLS